jgi:hypothetical protein
MYVESRHWRGCKNSNSGHGKCAVGLSYVESSELLVRVGRGALGVIALCAVGWGARVAVVADLWYVTISAGKANVV